MSALKTTTIHDPFGYEALAYAKLMGPNYLAILRALHLTLKPKLYVEIGVREGDSIVQALPETRIVGIDPVIQVSPADGRPASVLLASTTSDEFFKIRVMREKCRGFDLAFIDGDHSYAQAKRDLENLVALAKPSSIICLHDVIPMDERTSQASSEGLSFHTGDVWKLMAWVIETQPDLIAFTIACPPTGLGVIGKINPLGLAVWDDLNFTAFPAWDEQERLLNIIPNTSEAIMAALNR